MGGVKGPRWRILDVGCAFAHFHGHIDRLGKAGFGFIPRHVGYVHSRFKPSGLKNWIDRRSTARYDIDIFYSFARRCHRSDFDVELFMHLVGIELGVGLIRAVDFDFGNLPDRRKSFQIRPRHTTGTDHSHHVAVLARQIFYAQPGTTRDTHVLEKAIIDKSRRHPVARAEHDQHAEVSPGLNAMFILPLIALLSRPADDIRKHPRHHKTIALRSPRHQRPTVVAFGSFARQIDIDSSHSRRITLDDLLLRLVETLQSHRHR